MGKLLENNIKLEKEVIYNNNEERSKRYVYFDILNILACISVVFLHMNGIVHGYSESRSWKTALIFEVICYWAVPIFIMLSGATLLKYRERYDTKTFFKRRFIKVLVPWVIWSLILFIIDTKSLNIFQYIKDFIYCKIEGVYWFFPLILYLLYITAYSASHQALCGF
jgi:surface polysaccharide O-acyltransferase-like enzyme